MTDDEGRELAAESAAGGVAAGSVAALARAMYAAWLRAEESAGRQPAPAKTETGRGDPSPDEFEQLPAEQQRHWYKAATAEIRLLGAAGLRVLPLETAGNAAVLDASLLQPLRFRELVALYRSHREEWRGCPANFLRVGEALLQHSEAVAAYEVFQAGIESMAQAPVCDLALRRRLLQKAAQALADAGALRDSERILAGLYAAGARDGETMGLWAKVHKRVAVDSGDRRALAMALRLYREGYEAADSSGDVDGAIYNGVNTATMARLAGEPGLSREVSRRVHELCIAKESPGYWDWASLGECCLLEQGVEAALPHYRRAVDQAPLRDRLSMWQQALLICSRFGLDSDPLRQVFAPPSVLVFCGHRLDAGHAVPERFPPAGEETARRRIRAHIEALAPGFGYCSAMCGSDILFIEEMLDYGAEVHVYLPFAAARFAEAYVAYAGDEWLARFHTALSRVDSVTTVGEWDIGLNDRTHAFCSLYTFGAAVLQHRSTRCELRGLAIWDGVDDADSGTASVIDMWRRFGLEWEAIRVPEASGPRLHGRAPGATASDGERYTYLPMMFADVRGYSDLSGLQLYIFAQRFMTACARILADQAQGIYSTRTQGDSLFVVFRDLVSAVTTVRALRDMIAATDWAGSGLPADLAARFALDCGPCYAYDDAVTGRREICGSHVIRAARLEPVTPPGHIYASESFAALCAVHRVEADFEAAGSIMLPKSYGQMRVYHLC